MASALIQFRCDEQLKNEATALYEQLGLELSSAIKLFLSRSVLEGKLPFSFDLDKKLIASEARKARYQAYEHAKRKGISDMTLDEINDVIADVRKNKNKKKKSKLFGSAKDMGFDEEPEDISLS